MLGCRRAAWSLIAGLVLATGLTKAEPVEKDSAEFELNHSASQIFDGDALQNSWVNAGGTLEFKLTDGILTIVSTENNGWVQHDNDETPWELGTEDGESWTAEVRIRLANDEGNGIVIWGANGAERGILQVNTNNTKMFNAEVIDENDNTGGFNTFRIAYDWDDDYYYVWRNGALLTDGAAAQAGTTHSRFIVGDCCSNIPMTTIDLEYIRYDTTGSYSPPPAPATVAKNPESATVKVGDSVTFSAAFDGPITNYQWLKDGEAIEGGVGSSYSIEFVTKAHAGEYTLLGGNVIEDVMTEAATLTVLVDEVLPTITSASATDTFYTVVVVFSEPLDASSAADKGNYSFADDALSVENAALKNASTVVLTTSKQGEGSVYSLSVAGVKDESGNAVAADTTVSIQGFVFALGYLKFEYFAGIPGVHIEDLLDSDKYLNNEVDEVLYLSAFDTKSAFDSKGDNYGARISGWLIPDRAGDYGFFIASDDAGELHVSSDEAKENLEIVVQELSFSAQFEGGGDEEGYPFDTYVAGKRYYTELIYKEGGGGDGAMIAWRHVDDEETISINKLEPISGQHIGTYVDPSGSSVKINGQPQNLTAPVNATVSLSVSAEGSSAVGSYVQYQWRKNGADIAGATGAVLELSGYTLDDNGTVYTVVCSVPGMEVVSAEATLTVVVDDEAPTVVSVVSEGSQVTVEFSEPLRTDSGAVATTVPRDSAEFEFTAAATDIHDGEALLGDWVNAGGDLEYELTDDHLTLISAANNGWLQHDNDNTVWEKGTADGGSWTVEVRVRLADDDGNGMVIWAANGKERGILQINTDNTQNFGKQILNESDNTDVFHTFRMAYEAGSASYYFWRDGQLLNVEGAPRQGGTGSSRLIIGDCCSNIPMSSVDLEYIRYDTTGAFAPAGDVVTQGANSLANYSIAGVTVTGITVQEDGKTVVLTVDGKVDGGDSSLIIKGVADLAGNSIAETSVVIPASGPKITPLGSADFELVAAPADIYNGEALVNGWVNAGGETNFELSDGHLSLVSAANNGWLQHDNDESVWETGVTDGGSWTAEISLRLAADDGNGIVIWGANGAERNILQVNTGNTQTLTGTVLDTNDNTDGFHTFRLAFEAQDGLYYVWRDDVLLTADGIAMQASTGANRFIVGDCCGGIVMTTVDLEYIRYDTTGAFSPMPSKITPLNSDGFELVAGPSDIYDGENLVNGWVNAGGETNFELGDGFVSMISAANNGWLQHDNDESVWETGVADGGSWTAEVRIRLAADDGNGLVIWGANGAERNILQVNAGNTQTLTGTVLDTNDNTDGFHTFRLAFEAQDGLYYVWRDDVLLTPDGIAKQAGTGANRFIVGDCCGGIVMTTVDLEYIRYDTTGAFSPEALVVVEEPKITDVDSAAFELVAAPADIYDGEALANGWVNAGGETNFELNDGYVSMISAANNGWLQHDNDESVWETGVADGGSWTAEISIRLVNDEGNGLVIWGANGAERNILQVNTGNTQTLTGTVLDESDNTDAFHAFRLAFEAKDGLYYVWRDGKLLTPDGIAKQADTGASRFIIGDCCSGIPMTTVDLAYIRYDTTGAFSPPAISERDSAGFELAAGGSDIFDGEALVNGWANAGGETNFELNDGYVSMISAANNGWLQHDNDESAWETGVADGGSWTAEVRVRLANDEGNGLVIWGANGVERNILQVNTGNTQTLTGTVLDESDNTDGFHTFRLAFEARAGLYYVWRDGKLLTPDGIAKQAGTGANRFIVGDCCSGIVMTTVDLAHIRYDTTGAFSPVKISRRGAADFELVAGASDIFDGDALVNGWVNAGGETNFELGDGYLSMISASNNGWLQHDNDESVWETGVAGGGSWTAEISLRLANDEGNGVVIWGANGVERNILQVNTGNTQTLTGTVLDESDNTDGFHTFRLAFEAQDGLYYVWRDGVLLTPDGIAKQAGTGANRFIVGDCCSGIPMTTVDLGYISYDTTGAYSPAPAVAVTEAPTLSIVNNGDGSVTVTYEGKLQAAPTANGPWADVEGAVSPQIVPADQAMQFGRAVR